MKPHRNIDDINDQAFIQNEVRNLVRRNQTQDAMDLAFLFIQHHHSECLVDINGQTLPLRHETGLDATWHDPSIPRRLVKPLNLPLLWNIDTSFFLCADFLLHAYNTAKVIKSENFFPDEHQNFITYLVQCHKGISTFDVDRSPDMPLDEFDPAHLSMNVCRLSDFLRDIYKLRQKYTTDPKKFAFPYRIHYQLKITHSIMMCLAKEKKFGLGEVKYNRRVEDTFVFDENLQAEMEWQKQTLLRYFLNQSPLLSDAPPSLTYESKSLF